MLLMCVGIVLDDSTVFRSRLVIRGADTTTAQMWRMAAVLWRLSGSEAMIAAAIIHQVNQVGTAGNKCESFEALRHMFSKEVASLVTELARAQMSIPEHHGSAFNPNYSYNALLI